MEQIQTNKQNEYVLHVTLTWLLAIVLMPLVFLLAFLDGHPPGFSEIFPGLLAVWLIGLFAGLPALLVSYFVVHWLMSRPMHPFTRCIIWFFFVQLANAILIACFADSIFDITTFPILCWPGGATAVAMIIRYRAFAKLPADINP